MREIEQLTLISINATLVAWRRSLGQARPRTFRTTRADWRAGWQTDIIT